MRDNSTSAPVFVKTQSVSFQNLLSQDTPNILSEEELEFDSLTYAKHMSEYRNRCHEEHLAFYRIDLTPYDCHGII